MAKTVRNYGTLTRHPLEPPLGRTIGSRADFLKGTPETRRASLANRAHPKGVARRCRYVSTGALG
jgi:hypothetical protein